MARPNSYTPTEDAIILATPTGEDVQRRLTAAGFPWRSANAIKQRRHYLRNVKAEATADDASLAPEDRLARALRRRAQLTARFQTLVAEGDEIRAAIRAVSAEIGELLAAVRSELDRELALDVAQDREPA